jgi:hypothetical protein
MSAVDFLVQVLSKGVIVLDSGGEIQSEYRKRLSAKGQPGVGDRFYLEVLNSNPRVVERVDLELDDKGEFSILPDSLKSSSFHKDDHKFAAVALASGGTVVHAVDSDWVNHALELREAGVKVKHLCGNDTTKWFISTS